MVETVAFTVLLPPSVVTGTVSVDWTTLVETSPDPGTVLVVKSLFLRGGPPVMLIVPLAEMFLKKLVVVDAAPISNNVTAPMSK